MLRRDRDLLNHRIHRRAADMFEQGLLEETRDLIQDDALQGTAAQAIGYKEAAAVLSGDLEVPEAVEAVATRTRRYAKRQRTWFRNQMDARWIDVADGDTPETIADRVAAVWEKTGPFRFDPENS